MSGLSFHWLRRGERERREPLLRISDLHVKVGIREVLQGINLDVYEGDHVQITGPNGCGKSTLLNAIAGIPSARLMQGNIFFEEQDISSTPTHLRTGTGIAYLRQQEFLFEGLSIEENLRLMLGEHGRQRLQQEFPTLNNSLEIKKQVGHLSGGQKKKLALAMTILAPAKLLMFDEPEAGLSEHFTMPNDRTYLMVSHERDQGGL